MRVKYEERRAYYDSIVNRFGVGVDVEVEEPAEKGQQSFWKKLHRGASLRLGWGIP